MKSPRTTLGTSPITSRSRVGVFHQIWGEMWRYGCPRSSDCDSDGDGKIDDGVEEKEVSECVERDVRHVLEGPLWASVRACA